MKRELKKKVKSVDAADFTAKTLIASIDKQLNDLEKNNSEIESIVSILSKKELSSKQEDTLRKVLEDSMGLSSNMRSSLGDN